MIYYNLSSVFGGIFLSSCVGVLFSVISVMLDAIFNCMGAFIKLPIEVVKASSERSKIKEYIGHRRISNKSVGGVPLVIKDLIFLILCGFLLSLLLYIAVDGEIRAYVFLIVFASYAVSKKTVGKFLYKLSMRLIYALSGMFFICLVVIVIPLRFVSKKTIIAFKKIHFSNLVLKLRNGITQRRLSNCAKWSKK